MKTIALTLGMVPMTANECRARAYELLSLAERTMDADRRAEVLRFARLWLTLAEPMPELAPVRLPHEMPA